MGMPKSKEAREFYRCAGQRFVEAEVLQRAEHPTGAVYLAGYTVECIFKSLVLSSVPGKQVPSILRAFRGRVGHDYEQLYALYLRHRGAAMPREIARAFIFVNQWSTDIRYSTKAMKREYAEKFLENAAAIVKWADERL